MVDVGDFEFCGGGKCVCSWVIWDFVVVTVRMGEGEFFFELV